MTARVHVLVVAFHGDDALERSLGALPKGTSVVVVDNSSSSAVQQVALAHGASYVDSGTNLGFARGVNLGLRHIGSDTDVLLLNPDATLKENALEALVDQLHAPGNERVAAIAPRLIDLAGQEERVGWPFPSPTRAWLLAIGVGNLRSSAKFMIGAVLLLRREALTDIGAFDERFFLYAEETDWQRRAAAAGWRSVICADATAIHVGAASSADRRKREILFHAAQETYIRKWYGRRGWFIYRAAMVTGAIARGLLLRGARRADALQRARLYVRGPARSARLEP